MEKPFQLVKILYDQYEYLALVNQDQKSKEKPYYYFINKNCLFPNKNLPINQINVNLKLAEPRLKQDKILKPNIKEYITYSLKIKEENLIQLKLNYYN